MTFLLFHISEIEFYMMFSFVVFFCIHENVAEFYENKNWFSDLGKSRKTLKTFMIQDDRVQICLCFLCMNEITMGQIEKVHN